MLRTINRQKKIALLILILVAPWLMAGCTLWGDRFAGGDNRTTRDAEIETFVGGLRLVNGDAESAYRLAVHYQRRGKHAWAIEAFQRALSINPRFAAAYSGLGVSLDHQAQYALAQSAYVQALAIDPNLDYVWNNMGYSAMLQGDPERAAAYYAKAIGLNGDNPRYRNNLQVASRQLKWSDGAGDSAAHIASVLAQAGAANGGPAETAGGREPASGDLNARGSRREPAPHAIQRGPDPVAPAKAVAAPMMLSAVGRAAAVTPNASGDAAAYSAAMETEGNVPDTGGRGVEPAAMTVRNAAVDLVITGAGTASGVQAASGTLAVELARAGQGYTLVLPATTEPQPGAGGQCFAARPAPESPAVGGKPTAPLLRDAEFTVVPVFKLRPESLLPLPASPPDASLLGSGKPGPPGTAMTSLMPIPVRLTTPAALNEKLKAAEQPLVEVSNGNGINGMAGCLGQFLARKGIGVGHVTNADHFHHSKTLLYYRRGYLQEAWAVAKLIPGYQEMQLTASDLRARTKIKVLIGSDIGHYLEVFKAG